jgi:hypothetical protein
VTETRLIAAKTLEEATKMVEKSVNRTAACKTPHDASGDRIRLDLIKWRKREARDFDPNDVFNEAVHLLDESATHPIAPHWGALAALLLLAGMSLTRRHALPAHPMTAHSGAYNCRIY